MTIKEFIERANQAAYVLKNSNHIYIFSNQEDMHIARGDWFLKLDLTAQGLDSRSNWECADFLRDVDLFYILGLVQELRKTPVKERFPEKKYRLYVMRNATGPIPDKCYLGNYGRSGTDEHFDYVRQEDAWVLSENQIKNIRSYTPLIDAFKKEEVKDDD